MKGKRWLLLSRWMNLTGAKRQELNELFTLNRKVFKAYLLKESLDRLWTYRYEGAMVNYLQRWIDQLRWQRLKPFQKLTEMLLGHFDGILNYGRTKVPWGSWKRSMAISRLCYVAVAATRICGNLLLKRSAWRRPDRIHW